MKSAHLVFLIIFSLSFQAVEAFADIHSDAKGASYQSEAPVDNHGGMECSTHCCHFHSASIQSAKNVTFHFSLRANATAHYQVFYRSIYLDPILRPPLQA